MYFYLSWVLAIWQWCAKCVFICVYLNCHSLILLDTCADIFKNNFTHIYLCLILTYRWPRAFLFSFFYSLCFVCIIFMACLQFTDIFFSSAQSVIFFHFRYCIFLVLEHLFCSCHFSTKFFYLFIMSTLPFKSLNVFIIAISMSLSHNSICVMSACLLTVYSLFLSVYSHV